MTGEAAKKFAHHKNQQASTIRAKKLRRSGSVIEKMLWRALRDSQKQKDIKFRYQHPISPYIVDFACLAAKLIVEIDGDSHDSTIDYDLRREEYLKKEGYHIARFTNDDVFYDVESVMLAMQNKARELMLMRWNQDPSPKSLSDFDPPARGG